MIWVGFGVALFVLSIVSFLPESPRWLAEHGREEEAKAVLARVMSPEDAKFEWDSILQKTEEDKREAAAGSSRGVGWRSWMVALALPFLSQACGTEVAVLYAPTLLKNTASPLAGNFAVGAFKAIFILVPLLGLYTFGRRSLLIVSALGQCLSAGLLAIAFAYYDVLILPGLLLFVATFSCGLSTLTFVLPAEIFPTHLRARGMGMAYFLNRLASGTISGTYLTLAEAVGPSSVFSFFAAVGCLTAIFVVAVPETMGKPLEETARMLDSEKKVP